MGTKKEETPRRGPQGWNVAIYKTLYTLIVFFAILAAGIVFLGPIAGVSLLEAGVITKVKEGQAADWQVLVFMAVLVVFCSLLAAIGTPIFFWLISPRLNPPYLMDNEWEKLRKEVFGDLSLPWVVVLSVVMLVLVLLPFSFLAWWWVTP